MSEGRLERSDSKSNILPTYITYNLPLFASLFAAAASVTISGGAMGLYYLGGLEQHSSALEKENFRYWHFLLGLFTRR